MALNEIIVSLVIYQLPSIPKHCGSFLRSMFYLHCFAVLTDNGASAWWPTADATAAADV